MSDGKRRSRISPEDIATAWEAYQREGTWQAAGDAIGRDQSVTRRAILREYTSAKSGKVDPYAHALDRASGEVASLLLMTVARLRKALRAADSESLPDVVAQINDTARALTTTRTAHAKLVGDHAPEKHEHSGDALALFAGRIARLADSSEEGEGTSGPH